MDWQWGSWVMMEVCIVLMGVVNTPHKTDGAEYTNVALGKPTKQRDTSHSGVSRYAVDGNRNSYYFAYSCTHTHHALHAWWMVDLLDRYNVQSVAITNRNTIPERLSNFFVYVSEVDPLPLPPVDGIFKGQVCLEYKGSFPVSGPHSVPCDEIVTGRYVYIYKPDTNPLTLCEVEVMGAEVPPDSVQGQFVQYVGRKSTLSPFYSTTMLSHSTVKCISKCLSRRESVATTVQFRKSTKMCECILKDASSTSGADYVLDVDWTLMECV